MNRLSWFENGYAKEALYLGILPTSEFAKFTRYKLFLSYFNGISKDEAMELTAQFSRCSKRTIERDVNYFEKSPTF